MMLPEGGNSATDMVALICCDISYCVGLVGLGRDKTNLPLRLMAR